MPNSDLDPLKNLLETPYPKGIPRRCIFTNFNATESWTPPWIEDNHSRVKNVPTSIRYVGARENPIFGERIKSREKKIFQLFIKIEMIIAIYGYDKLKKEYINEFRYLQAQNLADMGFKDIEKIEEAKTESIEEMLENIMLKRLNKID